MLFPQKIDNKTVRKINIIKKTVSSIILDKNLIIYTFGNLKRRFKNKIYNII